MVKKRVHEIARELNLESREIIKRLNSIGIDVKSHMSTLEDDEIVRLRESFKAEKEKKPAFTGQEKEMTAPAARAKEKPEEKKTGEPSLDAAKKLIEKTALDRAAGGERTKDEKAAKTDFYKRHGMVDRVPSRPPDRRFQEKPSHPDKSRPWLQPKSEQRRKEIPQDRTRQERIQAKPQQEVPQSEKLLKEREDRLKHGRPAGAQKEGLPQGRQQEKKMLQDRPYQDLRARQDGLKKTVAGPKQGFPPRTAAEKIQTPGGRARMEERGFQPQGHQGLKSRTTERPAFQGAGPGTRTKIDQSALWSKIHPEDRDRFLGDKGRAADKQKQYAKAISQRPAKGRSDKREAIAEHAEERLRPRTAAGGQRKKAAGKSRETVHRLAQPAEKRPVVIGESVTVQELAMKIYRSPAEVIKKLLQLGVFATINQELDADTASIIASEFGYEVDVRLPVDLEAMVMQEEQDNPEDLEYRPCIVTVMGHVDHGKTSLLDAIRQTNVTATEAGGITQHIGAYQVEHNGKKITFVDTPGHEAFTAMRARGAQVTDIAILVVAADDGVMPQTVEALNHAKDARVPVIVAINKIDKPGANADRVKQQLTEHGLVAEEWGGDTICVNVSAVKREGITELLEMILLVAEMNEFKANPNRPARGTVIEAELDKGRGPVATVLVQRGTLNIGDNIIAGSTYGRVRAMMDDKGRRIKKAGPSTPVEVLGFSEVPQAGDIFVVVEDEKLARNIAIRRQARKREEELKSGTRVSLEDLFNQIKEGKIKELGIIIKADVQGSVEALRQSLERLNTGEVKVNIIHGGVGAISETDIMLASASNAIVIGFNVRPDVNARKAAENEKVDVRLYRVIYDAIEDVRAAMSGLLEPEYREVLLGRAEIRKIFRASKVGTIAGCYVLEGKIERDAGVRVVRDGIVVYEGKLDSLKRFKDDVKEVLQGYECGITLEKFGEIQEGDIIEAFTVETVKRQLS
ncbi:MAG TPA: translation initiation factor IF-2 [Bacillota bacterium]|nr:translation initiation factor IF-2 [Bacillota bacterium]